MKVDAYALFGFRCTHAYACMQMRCGAADTRLPRSADDSVGIYRVIGSQDALEGPLQILYSSNAGGVPPPMHDMRVLPGDPAAQHV